MTKSTDDTNSDANANASSHNSSNNSDNHNNSNNTSSSINDYGQFSEFHACFCGLDPGNLKFETVRTHKQHICF